MAAVATKRLYNDYLELVKEPLPNVRCAYLPDNIFLWHFMMAGCLQLHGREGQPVRGRLLFTGCVSFDKEFPFQPPSYRMLTQNGRFKPNEKVCITNSAFHKESWNPLWTVSGLLTGVVGFFHDTKERSFVGMHHPQSTAEYRKYARDSKQELLKVLEKNPDVKELFADIVEQVQKELKGAPPAHCLPVPAEHKKWLEEQEVKKKIAEGEARALQATLDNSTDLYGDEDYDHDEEDEEQSVAEDDDVIVISDSD
ncbi:Ubiquitin-conjugating enzyme E2 J2 [Aphelenchoides fujianensis]|nr:Ubiquitin-conjugating enzyme E2 J2 [Aphelenchoides fujianensis]